MRGWNSRRLTKNVAVMLSVARSRFRIAIQGMFLVVNGVGAILGVKYNHQTPNLYENEKHGSIGWVSVSITLAWVIMTLITAYTGSTCTSKCRRPGQTIVAATMAMFRHLDDPSHPDTHHLLSGSSDLLRSQSSLSSIDSEHQNLGHDQSCEDLGIEGNVADSGKWRSLRHSNVGHLLSRTFNKLSDSKRALQTVRIFKTVLDRVVLLFGFICIATGLVVYGGIFVSVPNGYMLQAYRLIRCPWLQRGNRIFNGLAHFIKGGAFFWYGFLTFGRWMGCFADFGWAWNKKPPKGIVGRWPAMMPSAEFIESAAICFYGATNVWLEHLSNPGGEWAANDLEHVSIALMFLGGGLVSTASNLKIEFRLPSARLARH